MTSLKVLWRHVVPDGMYFIEDLETSYYTMPAEDPLLHVGGPVGMPGTTIDILKKLLDVVVSGGSADSHAALTASGYARAAF
jgi:hypothetical protein